MKVIRLGETELPCDACGGDHETGHQRFCDDCWVEVPEWVESAFHEADIEFDTVTGQIESGVEYLVGDFSGSVQLDGNFSFKTLKAIVWWMEQGEIRYQRKPIEGVENEIK